MIARLIILLAVFLTLAVNLFDNYRGEIGPVDRAWAVGGRFLDDNPMLGCSADRSMCEIGDNYGGRVIAFMGGVLDLRSRPFQRVAITGFCASGCATFAAYGRPQVCITSEALFAFHQGSQGHDQPLPRDVRAWVLDHGGFPSSRSGETTNMSFQEASKFWPICWFFIPHVKQKDRDMKISTLAVALSLFATPAFAVDLNQEITMLDGTSIPDSAGGKQTLGAVVERALVAAIAPAMGQSPQSLQEEKNKRFWLALKLHGKKEIDLSADEILIIETAVGEAYPSPLFLGQVVRLIDPGKVPK